MKPVFFLMQICSRSPRKPGQWAQGFWVPRKPPQHQAAPTLPTLRCLTSRALDAAQGTGFTLLAHRPQAHAGDWRPEEDPGCCPPGDTANSGGF